MTTISIPSAGLTLSNPVRNHGKAGDGLTPVFRLDLIESTTKDLLEALKSQKKVSLQTGKQIAVHYGERNLVLQASSDAFPSELYTKPRDNDQELYFSGKLSHVLEVQKAREATARTDEALATLENTLKSMKEERAQNEVSFVKSKDDLKLLNKKDHKPSPLLGSNLRRDHLLGGTTRSTPSSPYLGAAYSPHPGPTSASLFRGRSVSAKDKLRLEAIRIPLIHLLASRPMSSKSIMEKIRAPKEDYDRLVEKVARDFEGSPGKKELKDKTYKDLDVWKFPYQSEDDRNAAINRAIHAFDRMRVEKMDPIWQFLLPSHERGKGKILSRLKFDRPVPSQTLLKSERGDMKGDASDVEGSKSPHRKGASAPKATAKKKGHESAPTSKAKTRPSSPHSEKKRDSSLPGRPPKHDVKFKSAERIEDSDEEAEEVDIIPAKSNTAAKRQPQPNSPAHSSRNVDMSPKKQVHKSTLSNSSSASDSSDNQGSNKSLKPPSREQPSKHSPRPRHDSSPQKPSPLGSSPPANSTDFDSSSSGKHSQSSAPSSPPSSTDMPIAKQKHKYSPVISERPRDVSRGRNPVKRKSDEHDGPPAKRHQPNGVHTEKLINGIKRSTERPTLERKATDSDQSSASDKGPPAREEVMDEAKRFQLYYKKYKELHEKLASKPENERDDKDLENLLNMHNRLKEMKAEIWGSWDKVERTAIT